MKKYFDNLRPFEKRVVVGVALAFFVVVNLWFVFPHFGDWGRAQARMEDAQAKVAKYLGEINQIPTYQKQIKSLIDENLEVPAEDQANQFSRAIQMQQAQSGVNVTSTSKQQTRTNQFFLELSQNIGVQSGEQQLVDFLFNLGSGNSLIRVRDMSLRPDAPRQALSANIKLVASYQKTYSSRPAPAKPAAPGGGTTR